MAFKLCLTGPSVELLIAHLFGFRWIVGVAICVTFGRTGLSSSQNVSNTSILFTLLTNIIRLHFPIPAFDAACSHHHVLLTFRHEFSATQYSSLRNETRSTCSPRERHFSAHWPRVRSRHTTSHIQSHQHSSISSMFIHRLLQQVQLHGAPNTPMEMPSIHSLHNAQIRAQKPNQAHQQRTPLLAVGRRRQQCRHPSSQLPLGFFEAI